MFKVEVRIGLRLAFSHAYTQHWLQCVKSCAVGHWCLNLSSAAGEGNKHEMVEKERRQAEA